ncbi:MAG: RloB domain-containing protein [Xenococcus sp. (in: cyanobacteria)]
MIFSYKEEIDNRPKNIDIEYLLWATKEKVIKEELFSYPYNRKRLIYRRHENKITQGSKVNKLDSEIWDNLRDNCSIVSFVAQFSAKKVLEEAKKIINKNGDDYKGYVVWFDRDTYNNSEDSNLLNSLKAKDNVRIYISNPCIENWLLAHFQKINHNEPECDRCMAILKQKYIARYEKNDCNMLTKFITKDNINTAIINYSAFQDIPKIVENNQLITT